MSAHDLTTLAGIAGVYRITCIANGRFYVGSAVDIQHRWSVHRDELTWDRHHNSHLQRTWNKYGSSAFTWEVIETVDSPLDGEDREEWARRVLLPREQHYLDTLEACKRGFNVLPTAGSNLGYRHRPEALARMADAQRGRKHTPEARAKMSAAKQNMSAEVRARMSATRKGRKLSPEHRAKIGAALKGKALSPEIKAKMSAAASNRSAEYRAKQSARRHSAATRAKMSAAAKGHVVSPETRAKISTAKQNISAETRARMSAAAKVRCQRQRARRPFVQLSLFSQSEDASLT